MSYQTAVDSIRRLAVQYQDMQAAADALEAIGSIEQATKEAVKAREAAVAERNNAIVELEAAKASIVDAKSKANKTLADAKAKAEEIMVKAGSGAELVAQSAQEQAQAVVDAAKAEAETAIVNMGEQLAVMQAKADALQKEIDDKLARASEADAAANLALAKLDKVKAQLAKMVEA